MKSTIILVHGAFAGQNSWQFVKPMLEQEGHTVRTLDLPAHGDDDTPPGQVTFDHYVETVANLIEAELGKVTVVGHSMAGVIISALAEKMLDKLDKLVYLCAYLPQNGQSLQDLAQMDAESLIGRNLQFAADYSSGSLPDDVAVQVFAGDCSDDIKELVRTHNKPEPLAAFQAKASLTEANFGRVPKYYIETLKDQGVGITLQKAMIATNGQVQNVYTIDSGHTPYWSHPEELVALLTTL